jgi:hypothetical protein
MRGDSMNPREEAILADRVEEAAFVDMYDAAPAALKSQRGLRVERTGGATALIAPRMPTSMFNRAIGLGLDRPATVGDLDALRYLYRDAGAGVNTIGVVTVLYQPSSSPPPPPRSTDPLSADPVSQSLPVPKSTPRLSSARASSSTTGVGSVNEPRS